MSRLKLYVTVLLIVGLMIPGNLIAAGKGATGKGNAQAAEREQATWLWHTREIVKDSRGIISFLAKNNVKDLYLQVDYDLDLNSYKSFIEKASQSSINVHALEGAPEWATGQGLDTQRVFFDWVIQYQDEALGKQKFKGIHLDVEPYILKEYHSNRNGTLEYYQEGLLDALSQSESLGLPLSVSIPFWFDEVVYSTRYGNGTMAEWIISRVNQVVIMAYRDTALGDNGIIKLVGAEIELAERYGAAVIVAVETQRSDEGNFISFYEEGQRQMNNELDKVYESYGGATGFGGFAVHHLMSWMKLKK